LLENIFPLLVLLSALIGAVVLPAHDLPTLATGDVADDMATRRHVPLARFPLLDVDDAVEEVGLAMLAAEVLFKRGCGVSLRYGG
jgi:hypothetical protein